MNMKKVATGVWGHLVGTFLAGLFAILPLILTVFIFTYAAGFIDGMIGPETAIGAQIEKVGSGFFLPGGIFAYAIGCSLIVAAIFVLGVLMRTGLSKLLHSVVNAIVKRVPLVGSVYKTSQQLVDMFESKDGDQLKGMSVVFCTFGDNGAGVLALMPTPTVFRVNDRDYQIVIIPTAPVPMGGGLLFMPVEHVQPSDVPVDGLMSIYVSMGVTSPEFLS